MLGGFIADNFLKQKLYFARWIDDGCGTISLLFISASVFGTNISLASNFNVVSIGNYHFGNGFQANISSMVGSYPKQEKSKLDTASQSSTWVSI
jgi:POT family proton-dependent oligopeptide transporter